SLQSPYCLPEKLRLPLRSLRVRPSRWNKRDALRLLPVRPRWQASAAVGRRARRCHRVATASESQDFGAAFPCLNREHPERHDRKIFHGKAVSAARREPRSRLRHPGLELESALYWRGESKD